ncbi:MAG: SPOR domain-containing protein [Phycisphaerae bacterium]|nr:SPOR domain-containing protein [Gemmatimonadaceae bacterium]
MPALGSMIAFDPEAGYLALSDTAGRAVRVDLRLGSVTIPAGGAPTQARSADGDAIYALLATGEVTRYTASGGDWKFKPAAPVSALFPQEDGSLILAGVTAKRVFVWRVRPPGTELVDSISLDAEGTAAELATNIAATGSTIGERVFFAANQSVLAVRSRDFGKALDVSMGGPVRALASTPSGDRIFVALTGEEQLRVIDRFQEAVVGKVKLPGEARELRMDPLGRVVLVRGGADTVWVVSVATDKVLGTVNSEWRQDLPLVLPDGQIAVAHDNDVIIAHSETFAETRSIANGARDFWQVLRWNGFRPRSASLDEPVRFRSGGVPANDSSRNPGTAVADSAARVMNVAPERRDSTPPARDTAGPPMFTVQFAAALTERLARSAAASVKVDGMTPRISTATREGKTLYRVTLGPFPTRAEAERVGKASGRDFYVYEGVP